MRIYRMTATFGKLEHETLELQPGMNIIHAPNEWGKSTWCAFLAAMLYGLDTRAKSTKTALADKERYAPWSGSPMAGRMDIHWKGRDITIERTTKGRIPLGEFRAYETDTGLAVPELTAANCGQLLLGVEQSVYRRSGFIRLSDLPVTADEDLRRRLNALVTTGDESGDAERLAKALKDLRNRCRYHRSGLIPQAEEEREALENRLAELESLQKNCRKLKQRLEEVGTWLRQLQNHGDSLSYAAAEEDARQVALARDAYEQTQARLSQLERSCAQLPSREEAEKKLRELEVFQENWSSARLEEQLLPGTPEPPEMAAPFAGLSREQAEDMVGQDLLRYELLRSTKPYLAFLLMAGAFLLLAGIGLWFREWLAAGIGLALGAAFGIPGLVRKKAWAAEAAFLADKYGSRDPEDWTRQLEQCQDAWKAYEWEKVSHRASRGDLDARLARLEKQRQSLCGLQEPEQVKAAWQRVLSLREEYSLAWREDQRAKQHLQALSTMAKTAAKPAFSDDLTYTEGETARLISDARQEQQRLQNRLGQYQGRMEALGEEAALEKELAQVNARLEKLENTYTALTIALETLNEARLELQRRFAPRITRRAQELMGAMTGGRYDALSLGEDFTLRAGAKQEDVLQSILWRSEGTVDQLYLALRLAVAEELTPNAPLVLDDALVRFDDDRMKAALEILKAEANTKQVILFSCQSREREAIS